MNDKRLRMILTPSNYCKEEFEKAGIKTPIEVLPHGINPDIFKPVAKKPDISDNLKGKFVFLFVGTTSAFANDRKGLDILLTAFSDTFHDNEKVELILKINNLYSSMMDPNYDFTNFLQKLNLRKINITIIDEDIDEQGLVTLYQRADCVVMPSRCEGFGMCGIEALACGTPLITTKCSGQLEYATEDNCEFVEVEGNCDPEKRFPYDNPKCQWFQPSIISLREKLQYVYENHKVCKRKAMKASKQIREAFSWQKIGEKMIEIFNRL